MLESPFFSIIIPMFNMGHTIRRCLLSVTSQSFKDMEIIVIDDGSSDDSLSIVKELACSDSRIRLLHQSNTGVSSARNKGIEVAQGIYLLFIDADDEIEADYLQHIADKAKESGSDIIIWGIKRYLPDGREEEWKPLIEGVFGRKEFLKAFPSVQYGRYKGFYGFVANKAVKNEIVCRFNLRFNTSLSLLEDYDFFLDCYSHCESFSCFPETGYKYTFNKGGKQKEVSFPPLIGIQIKCAEILKAEGVLTESNEQILFGAISRLAMAMFLDLTEVNRSTVKKRIDFLWQNPYCIRAIKETDTRWRFLKSMILNRNISGALLFTRFWRAYLKMRTGSMLFI